MNRTIIMVAGVFSASSLLLVDTAIKGTVLLLIAAFAAVIVRRDSAATRHLVWLLAIIALLFVPVLSVVLPQWRVLPEWTSMSLTPVVADIGPRPIAKPAEGAPESPQIATSVEDRPSSTSANQPIAHRPNSPPLMATPQISAEPAVWSWTWSNALPLAWAIGFSVLILRLMAARLMLWNSERRATTVRLSSQSVRDQPAQAINDTIATALTAACVQLGIARPVILLIHPDKTIPIVWGILRCRLLLPAAARQWSGEQLRSVLLHELAHVKRRDALTQLLAQIACALHWFNPLAWFAAWRLGVERERACDDLVLASGVQPSAYAGYLLEIVTDFSPARWSQPGGLAMARKSSLEGRLVAVLSKNQSRRSTSVALAAIGLTIALSIAAPIAMLRAADEQSAEISKSQPVVEPQPDSTQAGVDVKFPAPKPDAIRGLDLSTVAVRSFESAYRSLPDLYGPPSEKPWSGVYPANVFQMPLAEHAWLKYPAGSGHFYIEYRPDGTPQSEQVYGPIEGDPFEMLKLEELLREQMKSGATSGDPRYRLLLMFRSGEPGLVHRAWRMIEPELPPNSTARDGKVPLRSELVEGVRDALRDRAEAFLNPALKDIAAEAKQRIAAAEAVFDAFNGFGENPSVHNKYESVTYLQPRIAAKIPEPLWGKPLDGLRLGLAPRDGAPGIAWNELPPDTPLPTAITVEAGQEQNYQLVAENVSDHDIKLCGFFLGEERHRTLEVLNYNGQLVASQGRHTSIPGSPSYWRLKPGERLLLSMPAVHFMAAGSGELDEGLGYFVKAVPGKYTLRCSYRFGLFDNTRHRHDPANGVWVGQLTTGAQEITLTDSAAAQGASIPAESGPRAKNNTTLSGRLFVDAGVRTAQDEKRFSQSAIAIDPNTGKWTRLVNYGASGFTVPLSPVRVSPDGGAMLFMRDKEIWKCDAKTGENPARVLKQGQPKAWFPDGAEFIAAVEKDASRGDSTENWRVSADGTKHSVLPLPPGDVIEDWSADGRWLVGWSHTDGQLYIVKPDGSERRRLTNATSKASREEHPRFSPNGRQIVYLQTMYGGAGGAQESRFSLRTINIDGTDDREILGETAVQPAPATPAWTAPMTACWSPDGKRLAVVLCDHARDGGIMAINGNWRLAIIDADGKNLRELKLEGVLTAVLMGDAPEWRPDVAEPQPPAVPKPELKPSPKLPTGMEERLQWGQPVNGLRAAVVIRKATDEPKAGEMPELYLALQNVTDAPIRLSDANVSPKVNLRMLYIKIDGKTQMGLGAREPALGDHTLQTREIVLMPMFSSEALATEGYTTGAVIVEGALKDVRQTVSAKFEIEQAPTGAWTGKLKTGETTGVVAAGKLQLKNDKAQALFKMWQEHARANDNIPGALIGELAARVTKFTKYNPAWKTTPQLRKMLPRFDATRDWSEQDAAALLDELAAVQATPISMVLSDEVERTVKTGAPLPPELGDAPWGEALPNGLRMAALLEPREAEHRLGTALKLRHYLHNSGKSPVVFRTHTWHQSSGTARDANGAVLNGSGVLWTTLPPLVVFRLAPGETIELSAPGVGVGKGAGTGEWADVRVGVTFEAKDGDDVTFTPSPLSLNERRNIELYEPKQTPQSVERWWPDFIAERLNRELPLPADVGERTRLLDRAMRELFGAAPTAEEIALFVTDGAPNAMDSLAQRLAQRAGITSFIGSLQSGATKFRVLAADPDAASRPHVAIGPGKYTLSEHVRLTIVGRPVEGRRTNDAEIQFSSPNPSAEPPKPHKVEVPDGHGTWAIVCRPGTGVLWLLSKGAARKIEYSNPAQVKETPVARGSSEDVPAEFREAVKRILTIYDIPPAEQEALLSMSAENTAPAAETPK